MLSRSDQGGLAAVLSALVCVCVCACVLLTLSRWLLVQSFRPRVINKKQIEDEKVQAKLIEKLGGQRVSKVGTSHLHQDIARLLVFFRAFSLFVLALARRIRSWQ